MTMQVRNPITGATVPYAGSCDQACRDICGHCDQDCRDCVLVIEPTTGTARPFAGDARLSYRERTERAAEESRHELEAIANYDDTLRRAEEAEAWAGALAKALMNILTVHRNAFGTGMWRAAADAMGDLAATAIAKGPGKTLKEQQAFEAVITAARGCTNWREGYPIASFSTSALAVMRALDAYDEMRRQS